jgi:hypothetical protein
LAEEGGFADATGAVNGEDDDREFGRGEDVFEELEFFSSANELPLAFGADTVSECASRGSVRKMIV